MAWSGLFHTLEGTMKLVRTLSMIIALAGASTALADTPPAKAPAPAPTEKKADKPADKAPAPAPTPAKQEFTKAEVEKIEKFFSDFYDAVTKNQDACPKMATAINALFDKHQDWLKKLMESGKDLPQASKDKMQKKQQDLFQGVMKCKDDKGVEAAMQRFMTMAAGKKKTDTAAPAPAPKK
jgi:hypothetical protein